MASKFGLAGGIPERRVRPIWDAVDSRQFKNALKLSTALLSKYPNSPYALALKALILERMGKNEEALSVCLNAKEILCTNDSNVFVDDLTLSTLQIVFQRLDHLELATSCYEYACTKYPNNLELMMGLFSCYVREYSFVKQQQIAIKMYKIAGEERFLLWAVCSIQLQAHGQICMLQSIYPSLVRRFQKLNIRLDKDLSLSYHLLWIFIILGYEFFAGSLRYVVSDTYPIPFRLLYVMHAASGKNFWEGLENGDSLHNDMWLGRLLARAQGQDYVAAADVFQKVLVLCLMTGNVFCKYLGCLLEDGSIFHQRTLILSSTKIHECKNFQISEELFDSRMSQAVDFVRKFDVVKDHLIIPARCPYLAHLEIERRKLLFGKGDADKVVEV
ncbi:UNVERIFIED_CONTAM: N-terminal acetyltransferase B complex auxiliary subunit NAA25 [Sesamum angustifolium]|uniref:N-terminal acetyltransferase B complex auxiliary subunit NAA25 n=1 Tax=Sesamum angustifolium TaxID=2727405 RepID=A0AAW2QT48_9LAMI